jgi:hypothetical protein
VSNSIDFFSHYLDYVRGGETPATFNRWSAIAGIAAILERNTYIPFGHTSVYPNIYSMLIGTAGTRKSTAIKLAKKLVMKAGYDTVAAERTSKEKFLHDLSHKLHAEESANTDMLESSLFGTDTLRTDGTTPMFIAADEANDFFGVNNTDFLSILGSLWDWEGKYENKLKGSASDWIPNPTITILAGNTPTGFQRGFPPELLGQGFMSRLLIIYGEPNGSRITIPRSPSEEETGYIVSLFQAIKASQLGRKEYGPNAYELVDKIYQMQEATEDVRFDSYMNRRITHLLKLVLIVSAARLEKEISEIAVIQANTYLTYIETLMPKALGQYGAAKNADVAQKILDYLASQYEAVTMKDIWKQTDKDLDSITDLGAMLRNLIYADKIMASTSKLGNGFLIVRRQMTAEMDSSDAVKDGLVAFEEFLTPEEMEVKK